MPIVAAPSFDGTQFNIKLAQLMCEELAEEMERKVSEGYQRIIAEYYGSDEALHAVPRELREMHKRITETWVERTYEIYCSVWHRQGRSESAEFLDFIKKDVLDPLIESRINAVKERFEADGAQPRIPKPRSVFMHELDGFRRDMRELEKRWTRRLQIEALGTEIAKAVVPKHETSNLHQGTELREAVIAKAGEPFRWDQINDKLVRRKRSNLAKEMQKKFAEEKRRVQNESRQTGNAGAYWPKFLDMCVSNTDEWLAGTYQVYRDVWATQGNEKSAEFIGAVFEKGLVRVIADRRATIFGEMRSDPVRKRETPSSTAEDELTRRLQTLQADWKTKLEIEAIECGYPKRAREMTAGYKESAHGSNLSDDEAATFYLEQAAARLKVSLAKQLLDGLSRSRTSESERNAAADGSGVQSVKTQTKREADEHCQQKKGKGRPRSVVVATRQQAIQKIVANTGVTGESYCKHLDAAGLSTPLDWQKREGCPKKYVDAWNHPKLGERAKWRHRIADEKSKATAASRTNLPVR